MAQFLPPDHSKGDENTIGGYAAVHARPAAFEGSDGFSYSVELIVEQAGHDWGGFFFFVKWSRIGAQTPEGHLESDYVAHADTEADARALLGSVSLAAVQELLETLIRARDEEAVARRWLTAEPRDERRAQP